VVANRDDLIDRFLGAIDRELEGIVRRAGEPPRLRTLFVGGGTPTHLPPQALRRLLHLLRRRFQLDDSAEWSVEANPEDISRQTLSLLAEAGVNRISLGVQSFNDHKLAVLQRSHCGASAESVIRAAAEAIGNVSIDLIFAAPGETLDDWRRDLETALRLPITHVSTYALTFEKGTTFWNRKLRGDLLAVDESSELEMYDLAREALADNGFEHYEISNFAKPGRRCRHNLAYWQGKHWYAAGPGAAAFLSGCRTVNHRSTTTYLKRIEAGQSAIAESEPISGEQSAREAAAFGVRMIEGVDLDRIAAASGIDLVSLLDKPLRRLQAMGLIDRQGGAIKLTGRGIHFADTVAAELLG
jgi:oxygen-independent coproporphyrinogen-3 oxidase